MILGHFDRLCGRAVVGWAWDPARPSAILGVRVLVDGAVVAEGQAGLYRPDLEDAGIADGARSFSIPLPDAVMDGAVHHLTVLADGHAGLAGSPVDLVLPNLCFRALPPDPASYGETLAICAIAKNEARYLCEWVAYHRVVGVERFLIFDNESSDSSAAILDRLAGFGFLDRVPWPSSTTAPPQLSAYDAGLARLRDRCRWIAFIDLDEFLLPLDGDDIRRLLDDYEGAAGLVVPWRNFGSSGLDRAEDELVIRRFTHRAPDDHHLNHAVKTIVRGRYIQTAGIHTPIPAAGSLVDEDRVVAGSLGNPDHHPVPAARRLVLNHYFSKSREEWTHKRDRGIATTRKGQPTHIRPDSHFDLHDRNEVTDTRILRFEAAVRAEMARLAGASA